MTFQVLIADNMSPLAKEILGKYDGIEVTEKTGMKPEELKAEIAKYDGILMRSATKLTRELIEAASNLKVVARAGSGTDNIDKVAAREKGINVCNTPGQNTVSTAEHALSCMMSISRNIAWATASMKAGKWEKKKMQGHELYKRTLGIVGLGAIGKIVADRALGLKMNVIAFDPVVDETTAKDLGVKLVDFDTLLKEADYITVHTPLIDATRNLFNADTFGKMKDGAYLICCARGGIVNEDDLYEALKSGKLTGAHLDVFAEEPTSTHKLFELNNFACTPHLGASTAEAQVNVAVAAAEVVGDFLTKNELRFCVNP